MSPPGRTKSERERDHSERGEDPARLRLDVSSRCVAELTHVKVVPICIM